MMVGQQPGDREDIEGHPFVGPAGKLLDRALAEAGIDRGKVFVTNVVKHFNSVQRGKLRIHKKPSAKEIAACRPWLTLKSLACGPKLSSVLEQLQPRRSSAVLSMSQPSVRN
jgi:uracil-DNA glycosylase